MSEHDQSSDQPPETPTFTRPPGDISVYIAPGMQAVVLSELLHSEGYPTAHDIEELRGMVADLQREVEELRGGGHATPEPHEATAAPAAPRTPPQRPPTRPVGRR